MKLPPADGLLFFSEGKKRTVTPQPGNLTAMRILNSPIKRISAIMGVVGLFLIALSFGRYFTRNQATILTINQYYYWNTQSDGAAKASRQVRVEQNCATPIVADDYRKWKKSHAGEVAAMAPLPPFGAPSFIPNEDRMVIEAEPNNWGDLGISNLSDEALSELRSACLRYTPIYAHPSWVEARSDLGRWVNYGEPRPLIGFGLAGAGALGISGLLEACYRWIMRGHFRRPN